MTFDFAEVFTVAARRAVPLVLAKKLAFSFDCSGANVSVKGAPDAFQGACHRMFLAVVAMLRTGFVTFTATAQPAGRRIKLTVHAGGIGALDAEAVQQEIQTRLALQQPAEGTGAPMQGYWPAINGQINLHLVLQDGVLLTLETETDGAWDIPTEKRSAQGARAWFVNVDDHMGAAWLRRFTRLGWAVSQFASFEAAAAQLTQQPQSARPSIVVVVETGDPSTDGTASLPELLPKWTRLIYAVPAGSTSLREPHSVPGYEVHVFPFSPQQLEDFVAELDGPDTPTGQTRPAPLEAGHMPSVLLVDDSPVNLIVGRAMLEALGYAVTTADSGHRALEACQAGAAPTLVLMDVNMPEMNGVEATKHLRALQRQGAIPPFPIVGFTAAWSAEARRSCLDAGMDECLPKPLALQALAPHLRRVATMA
jgi:CheY-like chemotaxis protein